MDENDKSIAELVSIEFGGRHYGRTAIERAIRVAGLQPSGYTGRKAVCYNINQVADALKKHCRKNEDNTPIDSTNDSRKLKDQKIKEEIARLKQEKVRADLEIDELKRKLIDADEVREFLQLRFSLENALLRRILLINMPVEVTGVEIPKARKIAERYFNDIQQVMQETLILWQTKNITKQDEIQMPPNIQLIIDRLNNHGLPE